MSTASPSGTSSTKSSGDFVKAFATLRFVGDHLNPDEISRVLAEKPTKAYRKGERFSMGPRSAEVVGKTGVWYLSTRRRLASTNLTEHIDKILTIIFPFADGGNRFRQLRKIMRDADIEAHVTAFWRGPHDTQPPTIPRYTLDQLRKMPADLEKDFDFL